MVPFGGQTSELGTGCTESPTLGPDLRRWRDEVSLGADQPLDAKTLDGDRLGELGADLVARRPSDHGIGAIAPRKH